MLRLDHVGVVVDDMDLVADFFVALGFEAEGRVVLEGESVDKINGLDGVRAEVMMVRTPDRTGRLELIKYHSPAGEESARPEPMNRPGFRHVSIEVDELNTIVDTLRAKGFGTVGEVQDYGNYRLCYVRGPEGLIVEFDERIASNGD